MIQPSFQFIDNLRKLQPPRSGPGGFNGWWGQWQPDMIRHMLAHNRCTVQGASQTAGKSFCISLLLAARILCGRRELLGMPTLRQGARVLLRETLARLAPVENAVGKAFKRTMGNTLEVVWENGGGIMALSTDDSARKGIQGYTADDLIIDEAHETTREASLDMFLSRIGVALRRGDGSVICAGVGGTPGSLIEAIKQAGYAPFIADDERIMRDRPTPLPGESRTFADQFAGLKVDMLPQQYDQLYRCLPVRDGAAHPLLPGLRRVAVPKYLGGYPVKSAGVDIGRFSDSTVLAVLENDRGVNVLRFPLVIPAGKPFTEQALMIREVVDREQIHPRDVTFELNGMGVGLHDVCAYGLPVVAEDGTRGEFPALLPGCGGIALGWQMKENLADMLARWSRDGDLAVPEERDHAELSALGYKLAFSKSGNAVRVYDHNDKFSAGIMACCSKLRVGAVA